MNKHLLTGCFILATGLALWSCDDDDDKKTDDTIAVTGVTLDVSEATLLVGGTTTLTATVAPEDATDQTVSWSSGNTSVATVDSEGTVTAAGAGATTITVATTDGGYTATCAVTVTAGITLDISSLYYISLDESYTITVTQDDEAVDNSTLTWSSSDESVVSITSEGVITGTGTGNTTITATTTDGNNLSATSTVYVTENTLYGISNANKEYGPVSIETLAIAKDDDTYTFTLKPASDNSSSFTLTVNEDLIGSAFSPSDETEWTYSAHIYIYNSGGTITILNSSSSSSDQFETGSTISITTETVDDVTVYTIDFDIDKVNRSYINATYTGLADSETEE